MSLPVPDTCASETSRDNERLRSPNGDGPGEPTAVEDETSFERRYQALGWWTGPNALPANREANRSYWLSQGEVGARWIARRIGREDNVDVLAAVSSLLADFGSVAVAPILEALQHPVTTEQAEALLKSLRWNPLAAEKPHSQTLEMILTRFLTHDDEDVRLAAARATGILTRSQIHHLLVRERQRGAPVDVLNIIEEALHS